MRKIMAIMCFLIIVASVTPIFACKTTSTAATLTPEQLAKLDSTQTKLNALITQIDGLKITYKDTKAKGLLVALSQYRKQAVRLNKSIDYFKAHPPAYKGKLNERKTNKIIKIFQKKEYILEKKVALKAKILAKIKAKPTK